MKWNETIEDKTNTRENCLMSITIIKRVRQKNTRKDKNYQKKKKPKEENIDKIVIAVIFKNPFFLFSRQRAVFENHSKNNFIRLWRNRRDNTALCWKLAKGWSKKKHEEIGKTAETFSHFLISLISNTWMQKISWK